MKNNDYKKVGMSGWSDLGHTERVEINDYANSIVKNEISVGKKISKQNKKKKKSNHKHDYKEVLLRVTFSNPFTGKLNKELHLGKKCSVCGQIKETTWFITEKLDNGLSRQLTYDEIIKKYPDYEIVDYC